MGQASGGSLPHFQHRNTQALVWLTLSPAAQPHRNKCEWWSRAGRAASLEQLVSLTLWQKSQAAETLWVSWCGMGQEDGGGEGGEKNRDREHRCFLFSQKLSFHVSMLHVCSEIFIFFLFLFFLVLGLVWCCICWVFVLAAGGSIDKGSRRTNIIFLSSRLERNNKAELETACRGWASLRL